MEYSVAVAQYADTLRLNADRDDQDVYLFWKISGSISGDRDRNTAFITTRPNHAEAHSGQTQNAGDPGDVRLNGNGYVRTHYHIAEAGEISVPILVMKFADSALGGLVAHQVFVGAHAIDSSLDVVDVNEDVARTKRNLVRMARRVVLLADSSKDVRQSAADALKAALRHIAEASGLDAVNELLRSFEVPRSFG